MVNQYDYAYDSNASYTATWGTSYSGLASCTNLIELDLRNTGVRDYTPLNGLITSAKGTSHKLDISNQKTLDGDLGTEEIYVGDRTTGENVSTLCTLRLTDGSDFVNIIPTLNRLERYVGYWCHLTEHKQSGGFECPSSAFQNLEKLKNLQYLSSYWNSHSIWLGSEPIDLRETSLVVVYPYGFKGTFYFPVTMSSAQVTQSSPVFLQENSVFSQCGLAAAGLLDTESLVAVFAGFSRCPNLKSITMDCPLNTENLKNILLNYVPSITRYTSTYGWNAPRWDTLEGFEFFSNLSYIKIEGSNRSILSIGALGECFGVEDVRLTQTGIKYLDGLDELGIEQQARNEIILNNLTDNILTSSSWMSSKYYKDSNGRLTGDTGEVRWLSNLALNDNQIVDLYPLRELTHLTSLNLANNIALADTFEHNGSTIDMYDFINTLAENCFNNTGKKLTVNLKGTSITTITKNKINTTYCTLQSDV